MLYGGMDLRLPRFNFKAADIGAYSTVRYLGMLDGTLIPFAMKTLVSQRIIWI